jgi:hypothetical protein
MADKKITQLPSLSFISGSTTGYYAGEVVLPIVHNSTTVKMEAQKFALYATQWSATTASNTFIGNQTVNGNVTVTGKITAEEFHTEITSASIIYQQGSTQFGNDGNDTHTFTGTINVNGKVVGNAPLDFTSQSLNIATGSYNRLYDVTSSVHFTTASLNTQTGSQDLVNMRISSTTGSINNTTSSFDSVFLGISSFTGSFNSISGSYATTGSNTFRGNQIITGSLSISAGEFNVTTGSGNATSSLIFDHTQNDGVTLGLRHNDRLSVADHTLNVNVWAAGVYTTFVRNGTPYSILNVEAFDDNKIYLYRDTRLFNKSLVIDNNLTVQKDVVIGTGSLDINNGEFSITSGSGELTSSLSFTHTTIDPITGNATLALRYRNNDVGPENNAWRFVADDGGVKLSYDQYATSNKLLFSVSSLGSNFDKLLIWRDARLFGKGLTIDDSLLVKGVITGSLLATNGVVSSSNQLFELNQQTGSQSNLNVQIGIASASLNFTTGALNSFTGSIIGQTNTISTFTSSVNFATASLNTQTGSQESMNTTLSIVTGSMRAEIGGIEAYTASLKSAIVVNGNNVRIIGELTASRIYTEFITSSVLFVTGSNIIGDQSSDKHEFTGSVNLQDTLFIKGQAIGTGQLNAFTGSQIGKDFTLSILTSSIDAHILKQATQTGSQDLVNLGISTYTGSQNVINTSVNAHILKQATQTGSQDLVNYNISIVTSSIDAHILGISTYTGSQNIINTSVDSHILKQATQTGSQDLVNFNISVVTSSIDSHILKQATQTGSQDLVNLGISTFTGSLRSEVNLIEAYTASLTLKTGSYATTGSNIFIGNQTITGSLSMSGSMFISGSVYANTTSQSVASNTASLDFTAANFFMVQLGSSVTTHISASNLRAGQSVNVLVTTGTNSTASFSSNVRQPSGSFYLPTSGSGKKDILSFVSFDSTNLYLVAINQMI